IPPTRVRPQGRIAIGVLIRMLAVRHVREPFKGVAAEVVRRLHGAPIADPVGGICQGEHRATVHGGRQRGESV
ncbi:hypothetical protein HC928_12735, partial [bacterium]|nr:hypothetical protein [bacterium]